MAEILKADSEQALEALRAMVAEGEVRKGTAADSVCGVVPGLFVAPANDAEMSRVLAHARRELWMTTARGGGTKTDWGTAPAAIDLMISTAKFNRILEYAPDDMTVTVGAGVTIAQLQRELGAHGQGLALDCLWPERATVGGVVASNDCGSLRIRYGGIRDLIIGITVVLADGTIATSGGKVVKNVAGYDLPKLMAGALGTLGVITRAVFRLHPLPQGSRTLTFEFDSSDRANEFMLAITDSPAVPTGLQMRADASGKAEVDVRIDGIAAGIAAQSATVCKLAGGGSAEESKASDDPWQARERLWEFGGSSAYILKLSVLPAQLGSTATFIREAGADAAINQWSLLMHSTGLAWLGADGGDSGRSAEFIAALRRFVAPGGGSVVLLKASAELRQRVDVWGYADGALALMKRIKQQFDPAGILNRGRFVGGI